MCHHLPDAWAGRRAHNVASIRDTKMRYDKAGSSHLSQTEAEGIRKANVNLKQVMRLNQRFHKILLTAR